ncbi:phosphoribosyltransferase [Thermosulfuriphilus sp.]
MALVFEDKRLRNQRGVFSDRQEAGKKLAQMLSPLKGSPKTLILAIPAGGVPVGLTIAQSLALPFELLIVRKLPVPENPEAGFGAVTIEGDLFLNEALVTRLKLSPEMIQKIAQDVQKELRQRNVLFRKGRPLPDLSGQTVILVDDGLASGLTMLAAASLVRRKGAQKVIVAIPTAPPQSIERLKALVDEIYCPNIREGPFFAVAEAYRSWHDLGHQEVLSLLMRTSSEI